MPPVGKSIQSCEHPSVLQDFNPLHKPPSSEPSGQSETLLQTWDVFKQVRLFLHKNNLSSILQSVGDIKLSAKLEIS